MKKRKKYFMLLIILLGVGFAYLTANLTINGTAILTKKVWDVHFENIIVFDESVTAIQDATIVDDKSTEITFDVNLNKVGDFYEFRFDVVNDGNINAMLKSDPYISGLDDDLLKYLDLDIYYTYTTDRQSVKNKDFLKRGTKLNITVRMTYNEDIEVSDLLDEARNFSYSLIFEYKDYGRNDKANSVYESSFMNYLFNVKAGNYSSDDVGKEFYASGIGDVRVANVSTPEECNSNEFSQSACGVVLEVFTSTKEIKMNSTSTNVGGWKSSYARKYLNETFYNSISANIVPFIIDTRVISPSDSGGDNLVTNDKFYFLDTKEVYGDSVTSSFNPLKSYERQLDYYTSIGTTLNDYSGAIKYYFSSTKESWWLRSSTPGYSQTFLRVDSSGSLTSVNAISNIGMHFAFRIKTN